jgi:hypothetical protein
MIPDEHAQRIKELWAHLFGDLDGYLITFAGRQTAEPSTQPNELDEIRQRSWRWPAQKAAAAEYLLLIPA